MENEEWREATARENPSSKFYILNYTFRAAESGGENSAHHNHTVLACMAAEPAGAVVSADSLRVRLL
jgi:hypothetical protein